MEQKPKLISDAGRRYDRQKSIRPLNTPDRLRMYNSIEVEPTHNRSSSPKPSMQTVGREQKDSYLLRYNKDIVTNANYNPKYETILSQSKRTIFDKGHYERIIGDVRNEDYSQPLYEDCDRRCSDAFITLPHLDTIVTSRDVMKAKKRQHHINFSKQLSREKLSQSLDMKKVDSIRSTLETENYVQSTDHVKKRSKHKRNMQLHDALKKIHLFEQDIGHRYGDSLFIPKKIPDYYDIQKSNQQLIKPSMASPKGHVRFASYRQKVATRYDRADPTWSMTLNYEHKINPEWNESKTIQMEKVSERRLNQVYSKYPIRQSMQLVTPINYSPTKQ